MKTHVQTRFNTHADERLVDRYHCN